MNLFLKSYRICLFFFLLITCESSFNRGIEQEYHFSLNPWIQEIELPSIHRDIPCRSVFLDREGNLYIGKENGISILEKDGTIFGTDPYHIFMNGPVHLAEISPDTLFYASENDFGYLVRDVERLWEINTRKHWVPASRRTFIPSGVIPFENHHFILTDRGVVVVSETNAGMYLYPDESIKLFKAGGKLYLSAEGIGIQQWNGTEFQDMIGEEQFDGGYVVQILSKNGNLEMFTSLRTIYEYDPDVSWLHRTGSLPGTNEIIQMFPINGSGMLTLEKDGGISILDIQKRNLYNLSDATGISEGYVQQILIREGNEVWILTGYSMLTFTWPSPFSSVEFELNKTGRILTSGEWKGQYLLGTSNGVFGVSKEEKEPGTVTLSNLIPGHISPVHLLTSAGEYLFAAGSAYLYSFYNDSTYVLDTGNYTGMVALNNGTLLSSNENGLIRYNFSGKGWSAEYLDPALSFSHSFVTFEDQVFFLNNNKIYRLNRDRIQITRIPFERDEVLVDFFLLDQHLYLTSSTRDYLYNRAESIFQPLPGGRITRMLSSIQDSIPVLQHIGKIISLDFRDTFMYITGTNSLSVLDPKILYAGEYRPHLSIEILDQTKNVISLSFSGPPFQTSPHPVFRHKLMPSEDDWSEWSSSRSLNISGLKAGNYKMSAQVKDLYGNLSEIATLSFTVRPPVTRSWYAYLLYAILLVAGLFIIRKLQLLSYQRAEKSILLKWRKRSAQDASTTDGKESVDTETAEDQEQQSRSSRGKGKWDKYERATVLFSDIQGFTQIAEEMNPEALIDELDRFFFHFDSVVEKYNIEKIKTIGDAYMAAGGIPRKNSTNPVEVVLAALEMQSFMQDLKATKARIWDLRIGIHSGPVIAGVVGHKKVSYDIWGDTVNTASRMESSGEPGKVNISDATYKLVKDYFICEYRGKLPVKYKGNIEMYFVKGLRPELSVDLKATPNKRFFIKLQLLRMADLEEKVFSEILAGLPDAVHFHNVAHLRKVYNQALLLCNAEEVEYEEILLVRTAALMLYTGLTSSITSFENHSTEIAREILPEFNYSESQINQVSNLILSAKMPFEPRTRQEKIMIDARMEYIGKPDYTSNLRLLFRELKESGMHVSGQQFKHQQLEFLYGFEFFTVSGKRLREVSAADQMATLEEERWI